MKKIIHSFAGVTAFLLILTFFTSSFFAEISGNRELIVVVKFWILKGLWVLIPAMAITGISGFFLKGKNKIATEVVLAKLKRMRWIALNGLFILTPSAILLYKLAIEGQFTVTFFVIQGLEFVGGLINLYLIVKNIKDGLKLSGRINATVGGMFFLSIITFFTPMQATKADSNSRDILPVGKSCVVYRTTDMIIEEKK